MSIINHYNTCVFIRCIEKSSFQGWRDGSGPEHGPLLQRTRVQPTASTSGSRHLPVTPAPGHLTFSSGLLGHLYSLTCTHTERKTHILNEKVFFRKDKNFISSYELRTRLTPLDLSQTLQCLLIFVILFCFLFLLH